MVGKEKALHADTFVEYQKAFAGRRKGLDKRSLRVWLHDMAVEEGG